MTLNDQSYRIKKTINRIVNWFVSGIFIFGGILMVLPFLWMILSAFKPTSEIVRIIPTFFPENPTLENFKTVITEYSLGRYLVNSLVVSISTSLFILFTSSIIGYVFAKIKFKGREILFLFFMATMSIPFEILAIPLSWNSKLLEALINFGDLLSHS